MHVTSPFCSILLHALARHVPLHDRTSLLLLLVLLLSLQVVRARNVPLRRGHSVRVGASTSALVAAESVTPFVELSFGGVSCKTSASSGAAPQWNELISVPFKAPNNDYSPHALTCIREHVVITLFDEVAVEGVEDDRDRLTTVMRREHRYLGSVEIPFTTLYFNGRVEGEVRLRTPLATLGYCSGFGGAVAVPGSPGGTAAGRSDGLAVADSKTATHLYFSACLHPQLPPPPERRESGHPRAKGVEPAVMDHARAWQAKYAVKDRHVKVRWRCAGWLSHSLVSRASRRALCCCGRCVVPRGRSSGGPWTASTSCCTGT
jgi:hypothetical protein